MLKTRRQRTISGLVVVALILIFAPMFFHSDIKLHLVRPQSAPPIPSITTNIQVALPKPLKVSNATAQAAPLPQAWVINLASFDNKAEAETLKHHLLKQQYKAFLQQQQHMTTVYVGPMLDKALAEQQLKAVAKQTGIQGQVSPYNSML